MLIGSRCQDNAEHTMQHVSEICAGIVNMVSVTSVQSLPLLMAYNNSSHIIIRYRCNFTNGCALCLPFKYSK